MTDGPAEKVGQALEAERVKADLCGYFDGANDTREEYEAAQSRTDATIASLLEALEAAEGQRFLTEQTCQNAIDRALAAERRVERYEKALDGWFGAEGWRIADGSEVGVPDGTLIQCGVAAAALAESGEDTG